MTAYNGLPGSTDDLTGAEAARKVASKADAIREKVRQWFLATGPGSLWSPEEIANFIGVDKHSVRSRVTELTVEGFLVKTTHTTTSGETGMRVRLWKMAGAA